MKEAAVMKLAMAQMSMSGSMDENLKKSLAFKSVDIGKQAETQ